MSGHSLGLLGTRLPTVQQLPLSELVWVSIHILLSELEVMSTDGLING